MKLELVDPEELRLALRLNELLAVDGILLLEPLHVDLFDHILSKTSYFRNGFVRQTVGFHDLLHTSLTESKIRKLKKHTAACFFVHIPFYVSIHAVKATTLNTSAKLLYHIFSFFQ